MKVQFGVLIFVLFITFAASVAQSAPQAQSATAPAAAPAQQGATTAAQQTSSAATQAQQAAPAATQQATPATEQQGSSAATQQAAPAAEQHPSAAQQTAPATEQQSAPTADQTDESAAAPPAAHQTSDTTFEDEQVMDKIQGRLDESKLIMKELLTGRANIPNGIIARAKCIIVIPGVKKFAISFGVSYGRGEMTCRTGENYTGRWSAPAMYALEGGNFGLQIGLQGTDLVLVVMNERGVDALLRNKIKLGGDASVAAGPIGRNLQASTDIGMKAQILSYSRSRGVFAGISVEGSTVRPDNNANAVLYKREITARQIVKGGARVPAPAREFIAYLNENAGGEPPSTEARTSRDK